MIQPFFTTSNEITVGPTAIVSLLIPAALGSLAAPLTDEYIALALQLTLLSGIVLLALFCLRIGFLIENLISKPVLSGFTNAAAIIIMLGQVRAHLNRHLIASRARARTMACC